MNKPTARWQEPPRWVSACVVQVELEVVSPLSIGAGAADASGDSPVLRSEDGVPYIPGTTLAGVLRSQIEARLPSGAEGGPWRQAFARLFGGEPGADDSGGGMATLVVDDALPVGEAPTGRRDHVRLGDTTLTAMDRHKFDREHVVVGTRFQVRLEWRCAAEPSREPSEDQAIFAGVLALLAGSDGQPLTLGGRTRQGLGRVAAASGPRGGFAVRVFHLGTPKGLLDWIDGGGGAGPPDCPGPAQVAARLGLAPRTPLPRAPTGRLEVSLDLKVAGSLLVRSPGRPGASKPADASHVRRERRDAATGASTWEDVLPGSSLSGALRHRAQAIARTLAAPAAPTPGGQEGQTTEEGRKEADRRADDLVDLLFGRGPLQEAGANAERARAARAGALHRPEAVVTGARTLRHTRVAIDPWTGGALDGFLFQEDALYGGTVHLDFVLDDRTVGADHRGAARGLLLAALRGLLLAALRDLWEGDLPVGGEVGVGRGVLVATAGRWRSSAGESALVFTDGRLKDPPAEFHRWTHALVRHLEGTHA